MAKLEVGEIVGRYTVQSLIKEGEYNDTYRVADANGTPFFMKLYNMAAVPQQILNEAGEIREIAICRKLQHANIVSFVEDGIYDNGSEKMPYIISNYFSGELLAERLLRNVLFTVDEALLYITEILEGLQYIHNSGFLHNDITTRNIMFDVDEKGAATAKLIDMGHICEKETPKVMLGDTEPSFRAPETFRDTFLTASDQFSVACVFFVMLTGRNPWNYTEPDIEEDEDREKKIKTSLHMARLDGVDYTGTDIPEWLQRVLSKALNNKPDKRFKNIEDFLQALHDTDFEEEQEPFDEKKHFGKSSLNNSESQAAPEFTKNEQKGNGFADVAGMDDLKSMLQQKVIFLLKNKELAKKYRLTPPNGMLLYGPPGCGKTFFAEKFAEESGFNYSLVKASDLGSIYVHGSQGKIAELFDKAAAESPCILCFDEFDAMVPSRQNLNNENISGEVNEFLSQLNNCSKRGIFVIGTTNQPNLIDPAMLRKGRLDLLVYIPAPDTQVRKLMFDVNLKDRPCCDIDTARLAEITGNFVASDIAYVVNDAAMLSAFKEEPISQETLEMCIKNCRPSLTPDMFAYYEKLRLSIEGGENMAMERRPIGFTSYAKETE